MKNLLVIVGPTAAGKSGLAIELARKCNAEIISADSMQIYRHMNIGTAKVTKEEQAGIVHHMLNICEPTEDYSVAQFQAATLKKISEIHDRGKTAILVGGTGLYINALIYGYNFTTENIDETLRSNLYYAAEKYGNEQLLTCLANVAPMVANRLHVNDRKRIIRAWEVYIQTGNSLTVLEDDKQDFNLYPIIFGLNMERKLLYERINKRVDLMLEQGLINEVKELYDNNLLGRVARQALGYKEVIDYFEGLSTYSEMVDIIKLETRRYAKRQIIWFRRNDEIIWYNVNNYNSMSEIVDNIIIKLAGISKI